MPVSPDFNSVSAADSAYFGGGGDGDGGDGDGDGPGPNGGDGDGSTSAEWGKPQPGGSLDGGWTLVYQSVIGGERTRWFVLRYPGDGTREALNSSGVVESDGETDPLANLPQYDTESAARDAHQKWLDNGGDGEEETPDDSTDEGWGEWSRIRELNGGWYLFGRTSTDGERVQFAVSGETANGTAYLNASGSVQSEPHLFSSFADVQAALSAYGQGVEDGNVSSDDQPNGNAPSTETIRESVTKTSQSSEKLVEKLAGKKVLLAAVGGLGLAALSKGQQ